MTFVEKLKQNAAMYASDAFNASLSENEKIKLFRSTAKLVYDEAKRDGLLISYKNHEFQLSIRGFPPRNIGVELCDMESNKLARSLYGHGTCPIEVNRKRINDGRSLFRAVAHESVHLIQEDSKLGRNNNEVAREWVDTIKANIIPMRGQKTMFGIPIDGTVYINAKQSGADLLDERNMAFYTLMITERYAETLSDKYCNLVQNDDLSYSKARANAIETIRNMYNCANKSDMDICLMIDDAQRKVYNGIYPSNKLEARLMYDFVVTLAYQRDRIDMLEYHHRSRESSAMAALAEYQHKNKLDLKEPVFGIDDITNDKEEWGVLNFKRIKDLSIGDRINNPILIIQCINFYGKAGADLVADPELLRDWCWSIHNTLDDESLEATAKFLGPDFSPEVCREKIAEAKELLAKESHLTQDIDMESIVGPLIMEPHEYVEYIELGNRFDGEWQRADSPHDELHR